MRYSISWVYQGKGHYLSTESQITAVMAARGVSANLKTRVVVYTGVTEVAAYLNGEVVS